MSINVTVNGNPVSISRGKMVTLDSNTAAKKEFDKRRKIRLEQVRQQSKVIAENVRNRVRKEKSKQLSSVEQESKKKVEDLETRKLLELQNQYQESLKYIGLGHKQAELVNKAEEALASQEQANLVKAKERGEKAAQKLQAERNEKSIKKAAPIQRKKLARDVENIRSTWVSNINKKKIPTKKKKGRKKVVTDINISSIVRDSSDTNSESVPSSPEPVEDLQLISEHSDRKSECSDASGPRPELRNVCEAVAEAREEIIETDQSSDVRLSPEEMNRPMYYPVETRISERIRQRTLSSYDNVIASAGPSETQRNVIRSNPSLHRGSSVRFRQSQCNLDVCSCSQSSLDEIPPKPTIGIKKSTGNSRKSSSTTKVHLYNHDNRFHKEYVPSKSDVERIPDDKIEILPPSDREDEYKKLMEKRDREAEMRGKKAMERERINRDYKELLEKLPVLQRQERLLNIHTHNPEFHMDEDRLKEMEEKRQLRMENAFEKLLRPKQPIQLKKINLPKRNNEQLQPCRCPFRVIDLSGDQEDERAVNVGTWQSFDQHGNKEKTSKPARKEKGAENRLQNIFDKVKEQKRKLMEECEQLPENSRLDSILEDFGSGLLEKIKSKEKQGLENLRSKNPPSRTSKSAKQTETTMQHATVASKDEMQKKRKLTKETHKKYTSEADSTTENSSSPSPRKRAKLKSRQRILILQNTSTQTTPKHVVDTQTETVVEKSFLRDQVEVCKSTCERSTSPMCPCKFDARSDDRICKKDGKLCEIVIKIREDQASPEITVNPQEEKVESDKGKPMIVPKETVKAKEVKKGKAVDKTPANRRVLVPESTVKRTSWREQFSQNSQHTSSSTSYFSPPNFQKKTAFVTPDTVKLAGKRWDSILTDKPQQRNISSGSNTSGSVKMSEIPKHLLGKYIEKLLMMSHWSIENLGASTVSEVSTPGQSIVDTAENNPEAYIRKLLRNVDFNKTELGKYFSYSSEDSPVPDNTANSGSYGAVSSISDLSVKNNDNTGQHPKMMSKYNEIAETCSKRINNLTAMIEKVRSEKEKMMQSPRTPKTPPSSSDKENSTAYLELPQRATSGSPNDNSYVQDDLTKKLLEIDKNLVDKLKRMSAQEIQEEHEKILIDLTAESHSEVEDEIVTRFKNLLDANKPKDSTAKDEQPFVPLLLDIPKLPKFTVPSETEHVLSKSRKPPPAKGLLVAKRFNEDITAVPHELSTIVEADSQVSTKRQQSKVEGKKPSDEGIVIELDVSSDESKKSSDSSNASSNISIPDILTELKDTIKSDDKQVLEASKQKTVQKVSSSDSSTELESMETILRELGMGWAIATLRKTHEALALTSSSSSIDLSVKQREIRLTDTSSVSEVSLRELLSKLKVSTTTENETSLSSYMRELHDISSIQGSNSLKQDSKKQRTSTPVAHTSKSDEGAQNVQIIKKTFTEDSDLSSVKSQPIRNVKDVHFYSIHSNESS